MIYDIVISYQAEIDLRGIFEYIAFELKSPENEVVSLIGLKHVFYLVLYIPDDDTQVVTIIRAMYGGRDVDTQLKRFTKTK